MNRHEQLLSLRASGHVKRFHVLPYHKGQTVAEHCAQALNILFMLHPNPGPNLIKAVLYHDSAERVTGDLPATGKRANPDLKRAADRVEWDFYADHSLVKEAMEMLTQSEQHWLHAVDKVELWLWCHDEILMGNEHATVLLTRVEGYLRSYDGTPKEVIEFIEAMKLYMPRTFV